MMQITEKRQMSQPNTHVMGRNPLVSSPLCYSRLSPEDSSHSSLISYISDTHAAFIFSIPFFVCSCFFGPPIIVSGSHVWAVRCVSCLFSASLMGISNILHAGLHMEIDKSLCNGTVMRYQSPNLLQVKGAVIPLFGGKRI